MKERHSSGTVSAVIVSAVGLTDALISSRLLIKGYFELQINRLSKGVVYIMFKVKDERLTILPSQSGEI